jgi:iron only hydrogenase large subunit-like protein
VTANLKSIMAGDLSPFREPSALCGSNDGDVDMVLTGEAVRKVLAELASGKAQPEVVARWAEFVAINDREPEYENAIDEAVNRMRDLGDAIDGEITPEEAAKMIRELGGDSGEKALSEAELRREFHEHY